MCLRSAMRVGIIENRLKTKKMPNFHILVQNPSSIQIYDIVVIYTTLTNLRIT